MIMSKLCGIGSGLRSAGHASQNHTRMWNLVYSNHTVELINNATIMFPSYTRDGKPSVVLDYGRSEAFIFRQFRDEMREVRPLLGLLCTLSIPYSQFVDASVLPNTKLRVFGPLLYSIF